MAEARNQDPFALIREAQTNGANFDLDTDAIIARLTQWQSLCSFRVVRAEYDTVEIEFDTLPKDQDAFARELYEFCPDLVDQGTGCMAELLELAEESGQPIAPETQKLIEGVDFEDENYGIEILKREVEQGKKVTLWWD
ncbi:DUF4253 domain-containing protein [Pedosphaera parvula]|uniref:DUF4253 domain-containing protein n=1 Tax=Pedosphaera parvula (strain Ellin514) TaxID=320771 RepID=B9XHJ6_PEDPL|nr:DUF4253 domain-containing protein [Pedosphaera parvula]EEF60831.1 conserved hypothetical protein [Pedosphaera parvula Ellin514]